MCRLQNIDTCMGDYQKGVTIGQTDGQTDARQIDPYVPLCFAGHTKSIICSRYSNNQSCQKDNIARRRQPYVKIATISNP